jgi:hypothetical protein
VVVELVLGLAQRTQEVEAAPRQTDDGRVCRRAAGGSVLGMNSRLDTRQTAADEPKK